MKPEAITPPTVSISLEDLPPTAVDLIELIGLPDALRLIEAMPGVRFPMPEGEDNNEAGAARFSTLVGIVGEASARALLGRFHGTAMYVPSCKKAVLRARNRQMVADYPDLGIVGLGLKYRLSYRQVEAILKTTDTTPPAPAQQADLFV